MEKKIDIRINLHYAVIIISKIQFSSLIYCKSNLASVVSRYVHRQLKALPEPMKDAEPKQSLRIHHPVSFLFCFNQKLSIFCLFLTRLYIYKYKYRHIISVLSVRAKIGLIPLVLFLVFYIQCCGLLPLFFFWCLLGFSGI